MVKHGALAFMEDQLQINGVDLNVVIRGEGTPFLWAHGLSSSIGGEDALGWFGWDQMSKDLQLIRYDARGHGRSTSSYNPDDYRWPNLSKDMIALADHLHLSSFIVGGQSMGCGTSLYTALAIPERIKGLLLVNPPTAWQTRPAQAAIYRQMAQMIEAHGIAALAQAAQMQKPDPENWVAGLMSATDPMPYLSPDVKGFVTVLEGSAQSDLPDPAVFDSLTMPALILAWTGDPGHPLSSAETLAAHLPNNRLIIAHNAQEIAQWPELIRDFADQFQ